MTETRAWFEVHELLCRFFAAFDRADWDAMRACLADEVFTDYSSFRGTPPALVSREDYVASRRRALEMLDTQHNFSNLMVEPSERGATARCNYVVHRFAKGSRAFFHSYGAYVFEATKDGGRWRIVSIEQRHLRSDGDPSLHGGRPSVTNS